MPGFITGWLGVLVGLALNLKGVQDFGLTWNELTMVGAALAFIYTVSIMRDLRIGRDGVRRELQSFREGIAEERKPRIAISFDEKDPSCIQMTQAPNFTERRLRIGIQNVGGQTIEDARIDMYLSSTPFNPTPMSFMHEPPTRPSVPLHPKEKRYIDAFATYEGSGAPTGEVCIFYAVPGIPNLIPRNRRAFTIEALGKDIENCQKSFELIFPTKQEPTIRLLSTPDMAGSPPQSV